MGVWEGRKGQGKRGGENFFKKYSSTILKHTLRIKIQMRPVPFDTVRSILIDAVVWRIGFFFFYNIGDIPTSKRDETNPPRVGHKEPTLTESSEKLRGETIGFAYKDIHMDFHLLTG